MEWLNYHHLLYFWTVAREGGISAAAESLHLSHATISTQVRRLEDALGEPLLVRSGRRLRLTEMGRLVQSYADDIFRLGREMLDTVRDRPTGRPITFTVGIADVVPKLLARRLLEPARRLPAGVRMVCREGRPERLLADLATHALDMLLVDSPVLPDAGIRVFHHLLLESGTTLLGSAPLASRFRRHLPQSLDGAPFLLTTSNTAQRRGLEDWFERCRIRPKIVAEFDDNALLDVFAQEGTGLFAVPTVIEGEACARTGARRLLRIPQIKERFFAVTVERKIEHPAALAICSRHADPGARRR
jgi:LysR family transcriptional activator of nhaA